MIPRHCTHFWYAFETLITKLAIFSRNVTIYINVFGRYLGETHFVHKSRVVTRLKNKEKQNVIG